MVAVVLVGLLQRGELAMLKPLPLSSSIALRNVVLKPNAWAVSPASMK
jgi:hypothetical protein